MIDINDTWKVLLAKGHSKKHIEIALAITKGMQTISIASLDWLITDMIKSDINVNKYLEKSARTRNFNTIYENKRTSIPVRRK